MTGKRKLIRPPRGRSTWRRGGLRLERIVSGGQTGADRAALDFAIAHGIPHGGWCPRGRWAEDGPIPPHYALCETPSAVCDQRTCWNVRDSDGTVIFSIAPKLRGGSASTAALAARHRKPCLHLARAVAGASAALKLRQFLVAHRIRVLNVAGPRASAEPEVAAFVRETLQRALFPRTERAARPGDLGVTRAG